MEPEEIAIVAGFVVVYALLSRRFEISAVTSSMVFVAFGLAVSPSALDVVPLTVSNEVLLTLAEATLVLVLFTDAARIDIRRLRESPGVPARLLGIGMPLTIGLGTLLAMVLFDVLDGWEAFLVAAVLAPTDAALGQAVLSNRAVPARIRQALNVESGLNDGIAVPIIRVAIAGAVATLASDGAEVWIDFAAKQIGFGLLVGIGVGVVAGLAVHGATQRQWVSPTFQHIGILAVALLAFALAESVGGNGFIAAFVAGLALGNVERHLGEELFHFAEEEGQLLALLTFMIFGGAFVGPRLDEVTWEVVLYAVLSLTVIRMLPVALAMLRVGFQRDTVAFLGWFGPRGLASIVFALVVLETEEIAHREEIFLVVTWTVLISVYAHGLTAAPLARLYGRRAARMAAVPGMAEMAPIPEMRTRFK